MEASQHPSNGANEVSFDEAFSSPPALTQPPNGEVAFSEEPEHVNISSESEIAADAPVASWREEYDSHVATWRAQSAIEREKAELERQRWEAIRAKEKEEAASHGGVREVSISTRGHLPHEAEWEALSNANTNPAAPTSTSNITSTRNLANSTENSTCDSLEWERAYAPSRLPPRAPLPPSATLAVFDTSLSRSTRAKALFTSLAINLFLPFVNGVMLGFGEIFAKNVVLGWFGWKPPRPGSLASMTGITSDSRTPWNRSKTPVHS